MHNISSKFIIDDQMVVNQSYGSLNGHLFNESSKI